MLFAYDLSGSATAAGGLGTLSSAISYGLAMFGGVLVDSYDRRRLMAIRVSLSLLIWGGNECAGDNRCAQLSHI